MPAASVPQGLDLPRLHIAGRVVPVFSASGAVQVPDDPKVLGWWLGSRLAGSGAGTTVVVGHVDSATAGLGAFFDLGRGLARVGDEVRLSTASGTVVDYRVYAQRVYAKGTGIPRAVFASTGRPRLALITCGGPFDSRTGNYLDNVVVFASPVTYQG